MSSRPDRAGSSTPAAPSDDGLRRERSGPTDPDAMRGEDALDGARRALGVDRAVDVDDDAARAGAERAATRGDAGASGEAEAGRRDGRRWRDRRGEAERQLRNVDLRNLVQQVLDPADGLLDRVDEGPDRSHRGVDDRADRAEDA